MSLPVSIASQSVIRLRGATIEDLYGNETIDWPNADQKLIGGCSLQPEPASEFTDTREEVLSRWRLWAPVDADIEHTDRIMSDGVTYQVTGSVETWSQLGLAHRNCLLVAIDEGA